MKAKQKLIVCALIFLGGSIFSLFFSTALHGLLTREMTVLTFAPPAVCVASILSSRQHAMLFLCLEGFMAILAVFYYFTNLRPYQSELDEITPDIQTPRAVGQYQHGSARWLRDEEKDKVFNSFFLDPHDPFIKALLDSGYDNIDFLKKEGTHADNAPQNDSPAK